MNKKGILISETLRIIIALGVILLLIYLAVSLYGLFRTQTEIEQAKVVLDRIINKVNLLQEGEEDSYLVVGPKDWIITSFDEGVKSPAQCSGGNCLCICPYTISDIDEKCDDQGVCEIYEKKFRFSKDISIKKSTINPPSLLSISKLNEVYLSFVDRPSEEDISAQKRFDLNMLNYFLDYEGASPKKMRYMLYDLAKEKHEQKSARTEKFLKTEGYIIKDGKSFFRESDYYCGLYLYLKLLPSQTRNLAEISFPLKIYGTNFDKCGDVGKAFSEIFIEMEPPEGEEFPLKIELSVGSQF